MRDSQVPPAVRRAIRRGARGMCEYCRYPDHVGYAPFHCDHHTAKRLGGKSTEQNLVWSCPYCNGSKGGASGGIDPHTRRETPLFNPRVHRWLDHFEWQSNGLLIRGITPIGRATVSKLRMNRPLAIQAREFLLLLEEHPMHVHAAD
jgi:hypothetical protein